MASEEPAEPCDHYADHVGVEQFDLRDVDVECSWCGGDAVVGLRKEDRHELALCEEDRDVIEVLASG